MSITYKPYNVEAGLHRSVHFRTDLSRLQSRPLPSYIVPSYPRTLYPRTLVPSYPRTTLVQNLTRT
jgi:hypothetical protein